MRLLRTTVWGDEEVTFQDMQDSLKRKGMKGWSKLVGACKQACKEDWEYIWIDTCCIDKSSSSELSEAINLMYRYYRQAQVCYAYLADMRSDHLGRWTRGWTLQELIAPETVFFFTNKWEKTGTKASLQRLLQLLLAGADLKQSSIAARMSWAARRMTTRVEDRAYSLMGIFACIIRLQEEIIKVSHDHTIFAWKDWRPTNSGILATSPDVFEGSGEYMPFQSNNQRLFSITNMGLLLHLLLLPVDTVVLCTLNYSRQTQVEKIASNQLHLCYHASRCLSACPLSILAFVFVYVCVRKVYGCDVPYPLASAGYQEYLENFKCS
ncbi:hypothetical protein BDP27DRAFT_1385622 [Rhodocollybia butyracea]|uniref:Heterokaryon incompatibility domain-containing protein n=1 Tax=Rhodocollybia butyracea TaxID=206335 RepID=A0A9P5P897_9AGAR|nr:hypothetical protein BDP27DRAFT_1385622 [Rhodocollybia butyracea]